ncbi:exodeoxyribonuclease VII small subunit [Trichloromonas sp.]|uniref:exodeoxyribonuclease VII small subunit n=1 Tax=Trichloromonas sp. TaxID=3069249 RepID=UPI002A4063BC|nr:exodeoxyribonuclease VII small subunit [Trichloromonas sp.]
MARKTSFEGALKALQAAVESLEKEDLSLESSLAFFEEGVKNAALCRRLLDEVELKVEQLSQGADGGFVKQPFSQE